MRTYRLMAGLAISAVTLLAACGTGQPTAAPESTQPPTTSPTTTTVAPTSTTTVAPTTTTTRKPKPTTTPPRTTSKPKPKPQPKPVRGTPCRSSASACIDLSANRSWLLQGGKVILGPVPITHGRRGYRTPPGTFRVQWKDIDHKSSLFDDAPMPYSVFFNGGIAFHAGSLSEQSHGCIHLSYGTARTYYRNLQVGELVQVVP